MEDSFEYLNDLSGHNQEMAWKMAQDAVMPSDAQIEAEASMIAESKLIECEMCGFIGEKDVEVVIYRWGDYRFEGYENGWLCKDYNGCIKRTEGQEK